MSIFLEENNNTNKNYVFVSLGYYCKTSMLLKNLGEKTESYPFDWMVTCIENIIHILNNDFKEFLNKDNYILNNLKTKNKFYFENTKKYFNEIVDHQHHNLLNDNDYNYLLRCVDRFNNLQNKYEKINFIMIQPLYRKNNSFELEKVIELNNTLKKKFEKFNLIIINIIKKENNIYSYNNIDNIHIYELKTNIGKGPYGMEYFDKNGIREFQNIINNFK